MGGSLCLTCGLCCNGALFRDVELQAGDDAARLTALGLPVETSRGRLRFRQPCAALAADGCCRVYAERPCHCRQFECALLQGVQTGAVEWAAALRTIQATLRCAEKVRGLLRELDETDETSALSRRFRRVQRQMDQGGLDEDTAARYADLCLAVHELQLRLQRDFYP